MPPRRRRSRNSPLKLDPATVDGVRRRVEALHQTVSGYVAILVWNQRISPAVLDTSDQLGPLTSVPLPCSLRGITSALAVKGARAADVSVNRYLAALIDRDLARPRAPLVILYRESV